MRGILEQEIERMTAPKVMDTIIKRVQTSMPTKSLEDCLFGLVVGFTWARFTTLSIVNRRRDPTESEIQEFWQMIEKRVMYIKGRIKLALGR